MAEFDRMPRAIEEALSGAAFKRRRLVVAVTAGSRTSMNLIRRGQATLLYLTRGVAASIQARAGRGRACGTDPDRQLFPLSIERVRLDRPKPGEGNVALLAGPTFTGAGGRLFSEELFEELGKVGST